MRRLALAAPPPSSRASAGSYTATIGVTNSGGQTASKSVTLTVN